MALINVNVNDIKDRPPLAEGVYKFKIESFSELKTDKNGKLYIKAKLRIEANDEIYAITDGYLSLDSTRFRDFVRSTGHPDAVGDSFELIGLDGSCTLTQKVLDDGRIVNNVERYLPKV